MVFSLLLLIVNGDAWGQSTAKKLEVGAQFTSLTFFPQDSNGGGNVAEPGVGGRLTYNLTDRLAIESELNFFPDKNVFRFLGEGRALQGQFGVKVGQRFKRFGIFAKARPGFLSVGDVFSFEPGASLTRNGFTLANAQIARKTYFTTDVGAVLEFYPSGRTMVRFDAGDTIVRYGPTFAPGLGQLIRLPSEIKHNFQFTAGVGFRLKDTNPNRSNPPAKANRREKVPKYEVGIQFSSISFNPPTPICDECFLSEDRGPDTEPGFGGRFTYNLNKQIALEAEGNFFPRQQSISGGGGRLLQGQFGGKIGKRWERLGVFGKARPGLLSFSKVNQLVRTEIGMFGTIPYEFGIYSLKRKSYFSMDVGGVIEYYVSRRLMTRIDVGDTIVNYDKFAVPGFSVSRAIIRRPPETHHNFQFTAGVGFRF